LSLNPCVRDTHALVRRFFTSFLELTTDDCAFVSAGYPVYSHFTKKHQSTQGAFNYGGTNSSGQVPKLINNIGLIDAATPQSAYTKPSFQDPTQNWDLVFSDEFNVDGRTFWPGDDPYWEAVDLDYWQTVSVLVPVMHSLPMRASG
jgi:Beta-glucan synthesis-associated protein SKN1/KRE6/Sbg1